MLINDRLRGPKRSYIHPRRQRNSICGVKNARRIRDQNPGAGRRSRIIRPPLPITDDIDHRRMMMMNRIIKCSAIESRRPCSDASIPQFGVEQLSVLTSNKKNAVSEIGGCPVRRSGEDDSAAHGWSSLGSADPPEFKHTNISSCRICWCSHFQLIGSARTRDTESTQ